MQLINYQMLRRLEVCGFVCKVFEVITSRRLVFNWKKHTQYLALISRRKEAHSSQTFNDGFELNWKLTLFKCIKSDAIRQKRAISKGKSWLWKPLQNIRFVCKSHTTTFFWTESDDSILFFILFNLFVTSIDGNTLMASG